jgi:glutamine amidotransferase
MDVAVIDAGGANLGSVRYALERLGVEARVVREGAALAGADRVILPGVGAAAPAMAALQAQGFVAPLRAATVPLLGVCLGMQLLFEASAEGDVETLGLLPGRVGKLLPGDGLRWPHMGWNALEEVADDPLLEGIADGDHAYFVHGYAAPAGADTLASSDHGGRFAAIVRRGNALGAQFHPERSAATGARLLENFLRWPA